MNEDRQDRLTPEAVYEEFERPIARLCRRMIRNPSDAEDAAQEAWLEILRSLPEFQGRSKASTWVWTIARRAVLRYARKEKTYSTRFLRELFTIREDDGIDEMDRIPVEDRRPWIRLQCSDCLTGILHCVGNEDRFIYLLRRLVSMPFAEIAGVVGTTEAAARQACSRSSRRIRCFLAGECVLYNPSGSCRCKMRAPIREAEDPAAYERVRELSRRIAFVAAVESYHPDAPDYWKSLVPGKIPCHEKPVRVHQ